MFKEIKNQFLRFVLNLTVLILILFVIDRVAGNITKRFYFSQVAGANYRTTYAMDSTTADILVFGSSRANHHYVPEVFEDSLKMSFYNTGRDGNFILYNYAIFKSIISRYTPKVIILDLRPAELAFNPENYDRLSSLLPYYQYHPEIRSIVNLRSKYEKYKLLSSIYPYNSTLLTILFSNTEIARTEKSDNNGYVPLFGQMNDTIPTRQKNTEIKFDTINLNALESICAICKTNSIRLVIVHSPIYSIAPDSASNVRILNIAQKYNTTFVNYQDNPVFHANASLFKDRSHLNDKGAKIFSSLLATQINNNETNKILSQRFSKLKK